MTIPTVDAAPANPDPETDSSSTFSSKAAAFVLWLKTFATQLIATISAMNTTAAQVTTDATTASSAATTATTQAAAAAASAVTAVNAPGTSATSTTSLAIQTSLPAAVTLTIQTGKSWAEGQYVSITATASTANWMEGRISAYNSGTGQLDVSITRSQGTGTFTAWSVALAAAAQTTVTNSVQAKTGAFTAYATDIGRDFQCSGTWTLGFDAAASLGDGWYCYLTNASTGAITLDPNASELIGGVSTMYLNPGVTLLVTCDGSALYVKRVGSARPYLKVSDQKASGTAGGASVGADITQSRTLNTVEKNTISGASLSSDTITLPAGTYSIAARVPGYNGVNSHKAFLYNTADSLYTLDGSNSMASGAMTDSWIRGQFTITATKTFKIRHYTASTYATSGLGVNVGTGRIEVYTEVEIWKEA